MKKLRRHSCSKMQPREKAPGSVPPQGSPIAAEQDGGPSPESVPLQGSPIAAEQDGGPSLGSSLVRCSSSCMVSDTFNIEPTINLVVDTEANVIYS